jgi:hypothetical protein
MNLSDEGKSGSKIFFSNFSYELATKKKFQRLIQS